MGAPEGHSPLACMSGSVLLSPVQLAESCFRAASPEDSVALRAATVLGVAMGPAAMVLMVDVAARRDKLHGV